MKPKVSIIVPIYNVEKYLNRNLDSLLSQQLKDIEIIAVNDGSTDNSLEILQSYANRDNRIRVVDKANGGVSSARNEGLKRASGEYIGFVDPDDWINEEMFKQLYETAKADNADIVMCSYIREFGNHAKVKKFPGPEKISYQGDEVHSTIMRRLIGPINEEIAQPELLDAWGTVWSKIYRYDVVIGNEIRFKDLSEIGTNEDSLFNIEVFYHANTFVFLNQPYYHYWRANESSVTTGYKPALIDKWSNLFLIIETFIMEKNLSKSFDYALNNRICLNTLGLGLNEISKANKASTINKIRNLKLILNNKRIKQSFEQLEMQHFPLVWKMFYFCAKKQKAFSFYFLLSSIEWLRKVAR
ncbi:glycosyltransferase [Halalkalibacter akibai]|uniref:Glycosyltransferase n=1 Tax=Halalkalibacter akibai (strain ATCC 43226 / DSM 21942 / CIP 109018 / JCM 9157 / 1139) TaxID=1236973 RepID=W4QWB1_HALA3|nr:glycosyltransferase [Halalkalibacter akibai]GAE35918.1 glycosyltransferase [Halalkalibacter akibai JCM 9157]